MNDRPDQNIDGHKLTLAIKEEQVTVSPEGSEKIHVAVINKGDRDAYVDIHIKGVPDEWTTVEKPVVHVHPGETDQFTITVQPPPLPKSRVGRYPMDVEAVSQDDYKRIATARSYITVAAYQSEGRISVMLGSIYFSVSPGSSINVPVLLQNLGLQEDSFRLSIDGLPANWVSTNSTYTELEPNMSKEIQLSIRVPHTSEADAGRTPFTIRFTSQKYPDQKSEVDCILTITAFSLFSASLENGDLEGGQFGNLIIQNQGNTSDAYVLDFQSSGDLLQFEKIVPEEGKDQVQSESQQAVRVYEIPQGERVQVAAGQRITYPFRGRLKVRPIVGNEKSYPFSVKVISTGKKYVELAGEVSEKGWVPNWVIASTVIGFFLLCLLAIIPFSGLGNRASATQTAEFNMTQAALSGQGDSDGDGLTNAEEAIIGTDILLADTDGDGLTDGEENKTYATNPLATDTDDDGLTDGEEIQVYNTNPLEPDTDVDTLSDGAEIEVNTNPLIADTDQDGVNDGTEITLGTNPLQQDTDQDGLLDGQENQTCPRPLSPDSDSDGIIDGNDLEPCDPSNLLLTATALAGATQPSTIIAPTSTPVPTNPAVATPTIALPNLDDVLVFETNRDGNSEIYAMNLSNQTQLRLTNNSGTDTQPAIGPDQLRVAYVSNQSGNNEIYLTGLDRRTPVNLTNNPGDDQQPTWSPDGNWIAFTSNRDGNQEIYIMRSDGTDVRSLTNDSSNDFDPTWFSVRRLLGDEEWIAFTSIRDGNLEIYKIRPDGTGLKNITNNQANDYSPSGIAGVGILTFVTDRDGNPEVYTMNDDGGAPTNVTNNSAQESDPAIGHNGEWLLFVSDREGNLEVYLTQLIGGEVYNLTRNNNQDRYPDW